MENKEFFTIEDILNWGLGAKVKREIIVDDLIKDIPDPNKEQKDNLNKNWLDEMNFANKGELDNWLRLNGFNQKSFDEFLKRNWKLDKWCIKKFKNKIKSYYLQRKDELDELKFMIIRVSNKNLIDELFLRIKEKEDNFSKISTEYSEGPEKKSGGLIGPIKVSKIHPELSKFLLTCNPNELCSPIKIEENYFILKLIKKIIQPLDSNLELYLSKELGDKYIIDRISNIDFRK